MHRIVQWIGPCITPSLALLISCSSLEPAAPAEDELLDGPVEGLSFEQNSRFLAGDRAFNDEVFTSPTGLGPLFVATSCGSCHAGDGKGHPFSSLVRFGQTDSTGNRYLHAGGPQLQHRSIPGYAPESLPPGASHSTFIPPANTGLGYLELVPDEDLLAMADPEDANWDGISGVPNWAVLPAYIRPGSDKISRNGKYIHRFGKKASAFDLMHQTVNAYHQDIGISSSFAPTDIYTGLDIEPEISDLNIHQVVFYLQALKAPIQRKPDDPKIKAGKSLFTATGCEKCHKESLRTGPSPIAALSDKTFHPYTDLLLHDMGNALDDGYTEGNAKTYEWRTPPLWGLGLSPDSQGGQYFLLHDGRARSIEEAILLHGGEAETSRNKFNQLNVEDREALIRFLESL
ncbi:MAG TPA: di-heme oxidoredictase family protein [Saprospiraceae bacterium]|nr:di-heme oxidoredictase family protein [Saprospiraceae bacterium]